MIATLAAVVALFLAAALVREIIRHEGGPGRPRAPFPWRSFWRRVALGLGIGAPLVIAAAIYL
jgi:hypothetical protein